MWENDWSIHGTTTQNQGHSLNLSPVCLSVYEAAQSELIDITRLLLQVGKFRGQYTRQQQSVCGLFGLLNLLCAVEWTTPNIPLFSVKPTTETILLNSLRSPSPKVTSSASISELWTGSKGTAHWTERTCSRMTSLLFLLKQDPLQGAGQGQRNKLACQERWDICLGSNSYLSNEIKE